MQYTNLIWRDGQPYSELFDDIYFSSDNTELISGESEFMHVFFRHNHLARRWPGCEHFVIAELGFGSGLNCALTIREWLKYCASSDAQKTLHYIAIEKHPFSAKDVAKLLSRHPELRPICDEMVKNYPPAVEATHCRTLFDNKVVIHYKFMDIKQALDDEGLKVDAWFLDGFSPAKNPAMWSADVFEQIAKNSTSAASCSTYTAAGLVKRNLKQAGFEVKKVSGYGKKREMLVATLQQKISPVLLYRDKPWFSPAVNITSSSKAITIIGAGIAGLTMAYSMVNRGWTVTIIDEQGDVAKQASSNPAAIVYPRLSANNDIDSRFYLSAYCYSLHVLNSLQKTSSTEFWFDCGLQQAFDRKRISDILYRFQFNKDFVGLVEAKPGEAKRLPDEKVWLDYKNAGVVLPEVLCQVLREICGEALSIVHAHVDEIKSENNKCLCFSDAKQINEADCLVIANGISVNELNLSPELPVEAIRGQAMVLSNSTENSPSIDRAVNAGVYFTPSLAGKHYLGATYSHLNKSMAVDEEENLSLLELLDEIYPEHFTLDDMEESWVGFRCMAKDRVPVVGALPDTAFFKQHYADIHHGRHHKPYPAARHHSGLYITAAHGSRGFTSSFLSAEIIASQINGEPLPVNKNTLDYLSPSRFIVNKLKRG
jgi:tRNA 5-methylaminomethyl-2-thiouridine biosynthesis bifunctional protein